MAQTKKRSKKHEDDNFFEALGTTASRYQYRDAFDDDTERDQKAADDAKITAIITLVLVILVAVTMGILMLRGLQQIKGTVPASSTSAGSLQL